MHVRVHFPAHDPRAGDPHYAAFEQAKAHMKATGRYVCAVPGALHGGPIEAHHGEVEFALANDIDIPEFAKDHGVPAMTQEAFEQWVESEQNILPLCRYHHIGAEGVHVMPEPIWLAIREARAGVTIAEAEKADGTPLHGEALPQTAAQAKEH